MTTQPPKKWDAETGKIAAYNPEEAEAEKLFNEVLPNLNKKNANNLIQHIAAGSLNGGLQIGIGLRLMEMVTKWQMENAA